MPLVEREAELRQLEKLLDDVRATRGRLFVAEGPAGSGRTALLRALRDRADAHDVRVLGARASDLEREVPLAAARRLLGPDPGQALEGLGAGGPVVLLLDDVHHADAASLRVLVDLATRVEWWPVGLAVARCTGAPAADPVMLDELVEDSQAERAELRPLSPAGVRDLAEALAGQPADDGFAAALHELTGGSPHLVVAVLHEVLATAMAPVEATAEVLRRAGSAGLARSVLQQAGRLHPTAPAVLRAAAVLGSAQPVEALAALAGCADADAGAATDVLVGAGIMTAGPSGVAPRAPVVATALRRSMAPGEAAAAHARAAEVLRDRGADDELVAEQLAHAPPRGDPATVELLHRAARGALATGEPALAVRHLRRALEEPAEAAARPGLLTDLADALLRLGDDAACVCVDEALDGPVAPEAELGRSLRARADRLRALREPEVPPDAEELLALARDGASAQALAAAAGAALGAAAPDGPGFVVAAIAAVLSEDDDGVRAAACRAAERARSEGSVVAEATSAGAQGLLALAEGDLEAAEADVRRALQAIDAARLRLMLPVLGTASAVLSLERAGPEAAWEDLRALGLDHRAPPVLLGQGPIEVGALVLLARGRAREALAALELGRPGVAPLSRWRAVAARVHLALGAADRAAAMADEELARARAFGAPREVGAALRTAARCCSPQDAEPLLQEAVTVLEGSRDRLEHARALVELGALLRRTGRRADARAPLHRGQALALGCGAPALARRAADELAATGARSRTPDPAAADRLTASERRVAELAAGGLSNPAIAERLFVSRKTVELHLSSVYRKLGIGARTELARALSGSSPTG